MCSFVLETGGSARMSIPGGDGKRPAAQRIPAKAFVTSGWLPSAGADSALAR
ncbi:MAG: hypothetical protein ACR2J8_02610 [Thermomicrobiales bacterium]